MCFMSEKGHKKGGGGGSSPGQKLCPFPQRYSSSQRDIERGGRGVRPWPKVMSLSQEILQWAMRSCPGGCLPIRHSSKRHRNAMQ